ncbi:hypothetical protein HZS_6592, partial [Henneguya salminicola]
MVSGALNVSITTIEKEFQYNSFQVSFIDTAYNISFAICAIIIGYIITNNKIRWIGTGLLFISLGCLLFIIPVFIKNYDTVSLADSSLLCKTATTENIEKEACRSGSKIYLVIMYLAYCIIGVGAAPLHTLAVSYINENNNRKEAGLYNGIYFATSAVGPAITFVLYSFFIKIPIRNSQHNNFLTPESENWIGAYWVLYAIGCVLTFCTSIPMCLFPSLSKTNFKIRKSIVVQEKINFSRFLRITKIILRNIPYIFLCIGMFFDGMMKNAVGIFMAKYFESQFQIPSGKAALFAGVMMVLGTTLVIEFIVYIPQITFTIRISQEGDTGLTSLSLQQILLRVSYMLGPLLLSPLFDYSCVIFNPATNCAQ